MQSLDFSFLPRETQTCTVRVGSGALNLLLKTLSEPPSQRRLFLVSDSIVGPLYAEPLHRQLELRGCRVDTLQVPAGEAHKSRESKARVEDRLVELGAGRDSLLIAVGGGVVGDLTGFVASTWNRGVPVVQCPTTLLSMVDASLGGKTGVNHPQGKNLIGAFHQPTAIYADTRTLGTLPKAIYREGLAEVVKSGVVADREFFGWLERSVEGLNTQDPGVLERAVTSCMRIKGRIVTRDEREGGLRAVLNFGHTVAHAIEAVAQYRVSHGHAVAMGMVVEARLAVRHCALPEEHAERIRTLLQSLGLPTAVPTEYDREAIVQATHRDKKNRAGEVHYALPLKIGRMAPADHVTITLKDLELRRVLD